MRVAFLERGEGQALVIVGLAMMALLGAVALAVDWGFGYATRREMQNDADTAALTAGRRAASTFELAALGTTPAFEATREDVCAEVKAGIPTEVKAGIPSPKSTVEISFFGDANVTVPASWTKITTADCSVGAGLPVPPDTVYVRTRATTTYPSLFNVINRGPMTVGASARVRLTAGAAIRPLQRSGAGGQPGAGLSGSTTLPNAPIWPFMMRFPESQFGADSACGRFCDQSSREIPLWTDGVATKKDTVLVTFAHYSRQGQDVHQPITESELTGSSNGLSDWFQHGFGGSVSPGTDWSNAAWKQYAGGAVLPALQAKRTSCSDARARPYFPAPSCPDSGTSTRGDWVERVDTDLTPQMARRMLDFIRQNGRDTEASVKQGWGKAVVVNVFLWDCAERFDTNGKSKKEADDEEGGTWTLQGSSDTCSTVPFSPASGSDYRVHVFSVVPLTFYENSIKGYENAQKPRTISAFWGDAFGDAGDCQRSQNWSSSACALNPLMNSAFLVPDE